MPGPRRIHYLGPEGTFSHILAIKRFGARAEFEQCATLESVIEETVADPGSFGLLPVENSSGGTVYDSIDGLIRHAGNLGVTEELSLDVRIALLRKERGRVKTVFSHFTQIKHHSAWLELKFPGVKLVPVESTAEAARRAARTSGAAALASPGAAAIYGLGSVEIPPGTKAPNVTHFYVLRAGVPSPPSTDVATKTALIAALPNVCGSLHAFLGPFARLGISLSRIVSRPVPGKPQTYVFFVEVEGDERTPAVARALRRAEAFTESLVSLGSFAKGKRYKS